MQPSLPGRPLQGILTVVPNHDYDPSIRAPYSVARPGGVDVGELTGTSSGSGNLLGVRSPAAKDSQGKLRLVPELELDWSKCMVSSAYNSLVSAAAGKPVLYSDGLWMGLISLCLPSSSSQIMIESVLAW